jgi:putative aldouronate transport system substrate-binding protein
MNRKISILLSMTMIFMLLLTSFGYSAVTVKSIKLNSANVSLQVGKVLPIKASFTPSNSTNKSLIYKSSNTGIATVDKNGLIKGIKQGKAVITATSSENNKVLAKCEVTVTDPFGKYNSGIELTAVKWTLADFKYPEGDDISNNKYTRDIKDKLGISVKYNWTIDNTQYKNKLNVSIASGDLPDFFSCDARTFIALTKYGQLADLTTAYEQYASTDMVNYSNSFKEGFDSAKIKGKLYAIPQLGFGTITLPTILWMREDLLKKYDLKAPTTMSELIKIAEVFKKNTPDGYGFAVEKDLRTHLHSILGFANANHAYPGIFIKKNGKIEYGSIQPEMKTTLKQLQDLYKSGLIDKEFGIKDINKVNEDVVSGKVGIMFGPQWACYWPFPDAVKKDPKASWKPYPVPSADGKPVLYQGGWPVTEYFVVNKDCKNPEAVIKMANKFIADNQKYYAPKEGEVILSWQSTPVYFTNPMTDYDKHVRMAKALDKKDPSQLPDNEKGTYELAMQWVKDKNADAYGYYYQLSSEGSYSVIKKLVDKNKILMTELRGPDTSIYAEKKATLDKLELDVFTRIIMGASLSEFDKFVTDWKKLGGDASTSEINSTYNK